MTGKRLLKRILFTFALTAGLFLFLAAVNAEAAPIRPDIRKLVSEPQQDSTAELGPARAGWDGPEMSRDAQQVNPTLAIYDGAVAARAARITLLRAAIPDPRALLGIMAVILLLRLLRKRDQDRTAGMRALPAQVPQPEDHRLAA